MNPPHRVGCKTRHTEFLGGGSLWNMIPLCCALYEFLPAPSVLFVVSQSSGHWMRPAAAGVNLTCHHLSSTVTWVLRLRLHLLTTVSLILTPFCGHFTMPSSPLHLFVNKMKKVTLTPSFQRRSHELFKTKRPHTQVWPEIVLLLSLHLWVKHHFTCKARKDSAVNTIYSPWTSSEKTHCLVSPFRSPGMEVIAEWEKHLSASLRIF